MQVKLELNSEILLYIQQIGFQIFLPFLVIDMVVANMPLVIIGMPVPVAVVLGFIISVTLIVQHSNVDARLGPLQKHLSVTYGRNVERYTSERIAITGEREEARGIGRRQAHAAMRGGRAEPAHGVAAMDGVSVLHEENGMRHGRIVPFLAVPNLIHGEGGETSRRRGKPSPPGRNRPAILLDAIHGDRHLLCGFVDVDKDRRSDWARRLGRCGSR